MASVGVIIGRFQTHQLNETHIELINQVWTKHNKVMILLGCKPGAPDAVNPLSYGARQKMIQETFPHIIVQALPDASTNEQWSHSLDELVWAIFPTEKIVLYGEKETFIDKYTGKYSTVMLSPDALVNLSIDRELETEDFRAGVIYTVNNRYPIVYPTIDVAIVNPLKQMVLLSRKADEKKFRFVGGFVDPSDISYAHAALRELREETGFATAGGMDDVNVLTYIGSFHVADWRYPNADKIMTTFFEVDFRLNCGGRIAPNDDIVELTWKPIDETLVDEVMPFHQPMAKALIQKHTEGTGQ